MHILVSSTRQWNPGDEFIDRGVRNLLADVLPADASWHLWNRNPDLSIHPELNWRFRDSLVSNCVTRLHRELVDVVVFSGSPEWLGPRCEPLYDFIDRYADVPLFLIGIGSAAPLYGMSEVECRVLSRANTLIITRSEALALQINHILGCRKAIWLPCPAILCSMNYSHHLSKSIGVILQVPSGPQPITHPHFLLIKEALERWDEEFDLIAFHEAECHWLAHSFPGRRIRYSESAETYISWFREYSTIISTRLHGAIAASSSGAWSSLIKRNDFRVDSTAALFPIIYRGSPVEAFEQAKSLSAEGLMLHRQHAHNFKLSVREMYRETISAFTNSLYFAKKQP